MRNRHFPRLCRACEGPMARQEDACWRCGTRWAAEEAPRTARLIERQEPTRPAMPVRPTFGVASIRTGHDNVEAGLDAERWANEGGSILTARLPASTGRS